MSDDCEVALRRTAAELSPLLEPLGYEFHFGHADRGHLVFATGFFVRRELKIGLIYREKSSSVVRLGCVTYENAATGTTHDEVMSWLGLGAQQLLRYDPNALTSVAADGGSAIDALRADLVALSSVLRDEVMLTQVIGEARRQGIQAAQEAEARHAAKREAWLRRRRGGKE